MSAIPMKPKLYKKLMALSGVDFDLSKVPEGAMCGLQLDEQSYAMFEAMRDEDETLDETILRWMTANIHLAEVQRFH